jgi:bifunctional enzyme CysN/CysC
VDDGKSTLIGRLLYDSKSLLDDQLSAIEYATRSRGGTGADLALVTDGLRAEREQGITIDVAYRYFATPRRKFIVADTPGHQQYTRNMVTGASTADLAIILIDARKGMTEQSRRHATIASLLRVPHMVLAINKMDLVDWSQEVFEQIYSEFSDFAAKLSVPDLTAIPMSALLGDNVVARSPHMDWYAGSSLLHHLEHVHIASDRNLTDLRFPVQRVIRSHPGEPEYRGLAGQVMSGILRVGDDVMVLPSGLTSSISSIESPQGPLAYAVPPLSVAVTIAHDLDVSRGDMLCRVANHPAPTQDVDAMVCWMDAEPMRVGARLALLHTTRRVRAVVKSLDYRLDVNSLQRDTGAQALDLNDIGRVALRTTMPILVDDYADNRATGSFILIDESTSRTVGAGVVRGH